MEEMRSNSTQSIAFLEQRAKLLADHWPSV